MGRYNRKTERQSWSEESMTDGINAVLTKKMGYRKASKTFNLPQTTLERKVKEARKNGLTSVNTVEKYLGRFRTVFTKAQENELVAQLLALEDNLCDLTSTDIRAIAFDIAEKGNISHSFNREKKLAGNDWLYGFLQRHPELSLRNFEKNSLSKIIVNRTCLTNEEAASTSQTEN